MRMRPLRVALAQYNFTVGDLEANARRILEGVERARQAGCDLVAFPELALSGYPPEDLVFRAKFGRDNRAYLERVAAACGGVTVVVGFVEAADDVYNAAAVIHEGRIHVQRKRLLPTYSVFDEDRYFRAGDEHLLFTLRGVRLGVTICEDIWYDGGPAHLLAEWGAEVILNISSSPYYTGKHRYRRDMLAVRARDNVAAVAYVNLVGGQDELVFDGHSMILDAAGELLAQGQAFAEDFLVVDLDADAVARRRQQDPRGRKEPHQGPVRALTLSAEPGPARPPSPAIPVPAEDDVALDYQALTLGVRDYVEKNGFRRVIVGLSGGIDSALTAAVAADALGPERVLGVSMPSPYSSRASCTDARRLAENLGISFLVLPIHRIMAAYARALAVPFRGYPPDVTEENLQARIRGNLLMALSNKYPGHLVLSTSNKSEAAVGYTTLYGDMAGGFAVLKDVYKTRVYELARWRNAREAVIPQRCLTRPPSAELAPGQLDQDTLPPYPILDPILELYIEQDQAAEEIATRGFEEGVARRVARMVDQSEYKRRQAPVGIKITPKAFGRDRRLPITDRYPG